MTGNPLIDLAIALAGIAILVGIAQLVFGSNAPSLSMEKAAARLVFDEPDFAPQVWLMNKASDAALARNRIGEIALIVAHGDGLVTRRFAADQAPLKYQAGSLHVLRADHTSRTAAFELSEAAAGAWLHASSDKHTDDK